MIGRAQKQPGFMCQAFGCFRRLTSGPVPPPPLGVLALLALLWLLTSSCLASFQGGGAEIPDVTGNYDFLTATNTLALLEEEGKLKGYIDVLQGEDESDTVLSYSISLGSRTKNRVEFKTRKIHQKYYRFSGVVERGTGREEHDADYLRLVGELETITLDPATGAEVSQREQVVFRSKGQAEKGDEEE